MTRPAATQANIVATPDLVAVGLDAGVVRTAFQEHFGLPFARRHKDDLCQYLVVFVSVILLLSWAGLFKARLS